MRKFTLFLALMVTMLTTAFAQVLTVSDAPANGVWSENTTWYLIQNKKGGFVSTNADYCDASGKLRLHNSVLPTTDEALWCVTGDETNGYQFYNKAGGTNKVLYSTRELNTGSACFSMEDKADAENEFFDIQSSQKAGYIVVKDHNNANNYWNNRDNNLAYWNSSSATDDDGSAFTFVVVDDELDVLAEAEAILEEASLEIVTSDLVTTENADERLYSNAKCTDTRWGDEFKGWTVLLDNDANTFFHSEYASGKTSTDGLDHYLRVDAVESISEFAFSYTTRNIDNGYNHPNNLVVEGSNEPDGTYTTIREYNGELPNGGAVKFTSETLTCSEPYRYIRFRVVSTYQNNDKDAGGKPFFFLAEFSMFKSEITVGNAEFQDANDDVLALYEAVNTAKMSLNNLQTTVGTIRELNAIFNPVTPELPALEVASYKRNPLETAINGAYKLQGVQLFFGEIVKKYTTDLTADYGYILDAEGNEVAKLTKAMGGNGTTNDYVTPYANPAVETPGTYKVVVYPGVILSADGTKEYKGGEFEFTVAKRDPVVTPSAEEGFCYNETFTNVNDFKEFEIRIQYATEVVINNEKKVTMTCGDAVYEAVVTLEETNATTKYIKLAFDGEFAEGRYSIAVPAGLFTVDGVENAEFAASTFTYKKPALKITRDFDAWESYLTEKWYMPRNVIITIENAETVNVNEANLPTIVVGETTYTSTIKHYQDEWNYNYYIEFDFAELAAIYSSESGEDFIKGDYTFTLPAGLYTVNGVANEEAVKTFTYGDPIIEEFSVTNITPAVGVVESLETINITFSKYVQSEGLRVAYADTTYTFMNTGSSFVAVDVNYKPIVLTEPGTYTLDLSYLEGLTGDNVFTWTIEEPLTPVLELTADQLDTTYPYQLGAEDAEKVFALTDLTVAVRVNTPAALAGRKALFATADPTKVANTSAMPTNSYYVAYGLNNKDLGYLASWKDGDRYTTKEISENSEDVILVFVVNPTNNNFRSYVNGTNLQDRDFGSYEIATPAMVKADFPDANIYIGGAVNSNGAAEIFDGEITGVQVYEGALTAEQIAEIEFPEIVEPVPFEVVAWTPADVVESLQNIAIEFSEDIEGTFDIMGMTQIYVGSKSNGASFEVNGNILNVTLFDAITTPGEYSLVIPSGLITRKSNGDAVVVNSGEITFTVVEPAPAPFKVVAWTPADAVESLQNIAIEFSEDIEGTFDIMGMTQIYVGSKSNGASFEVNGNILNVTLFDAITTPGEYSLVIPSGLITRKSNGDAVVVNSGEITFTVVEPAPAPFKVVAWTPADAVESLQNIAIEFSEDIEGTFDIMGMTQIYVGSKSNGASFEVNGNILNVTLFDAITTPGEYSLVIPSGLITRKSNGEAVVVNSGEITFTVVAPAPKTFVIESAALFPTVDGDVTEIKSIRVEGGVGAALESLPTDWTFTNEAGDKFEMSIDWLYDYDTVLLMFNPAITTPGTYTLTIPAGSLKTDDGLECEAATYTFTVAAPAKVIEADKFYRIKSTTVGNYMTIGDANANTHGHVHGADMDENNADQVFSFIPVEGEENTYYLKSVAGKYITENGNGQGWNVNYTENADEALKLVFEAVGGELQYMIKCYNSSKYSYCYFKYEYVGASGMYHPFNDAASAIAEVWALEETVAPELPVAPLEVLAWTPADAVESLQNIAIEFSEDIEGTFDIMGMTQIYVGSKSNGASFEVNGNILNVTLFDAITTPGEYSLVIPSGLITRKSNGEAVVVNSGEITFTVVEGTGTAVDGVDAEVENAVIYDITGRRVAEIAKPGIYVVNGKKVLVK